MDKRGFPKKRVTSAASILKPHHEDADPLSGEVRPQELQRKNPSGQRVQRAEVRFNSLSSAVKSSTHVLIEKIPLITVVWVLSFSAATTLPAFSDLSLASASLFSSSDSQEASRADLLLPLLFLSPLCLSLTNLLFYRRLFYSKLPRRLFQLT